MAEFDPTREQLEAEERLATAQKQIEFVEAALWAVVRTHGPVMVLNSMHGSGVSRKKLGAWIENHKAVVASKPALKKQEKEAARHAVASAARHQPKLVAAL